MGSVYDRSSNIYRSDFKRIDLTNSGFFHLEDAEAKFVTIHNHQPNTAYHIEVAKVDRPTDPLSFPWDSSHGVHNQDVWGPSGTAHVISTSLPLEDGFSFEVRGISNANQVAIRKATHSHPVFSVSYVVEK